MKTTTLPLERLIPYAGNPRKNDHAVEQVAAAIKRFGFRVPVLAKSDRTVCLPDFQGLGLGKQVVTHLAGAWSGLGFRCFRATNHPGEIASLNHNLNWKMIIPPTRRSSDAGGRIKHSTDRLVASFEFIGQKMNPTQAAKLVG